MKPAGHIVASGALGLTLYAIKGDITPALSCFFAGWLMDLDHVLDWVKNLGLRRGVLSLLNFDNHFNFESYEESKHEVIHIYVFLHSWELIISFWGLCLLYTIAPVIIGVFLGFTLHLALDQISHELMSPLAYFFTYRIFHRFHVAAILEV